MIVLSAQDSDKHIDETAPKFFKAFSNMEALSVATPEAIQEQAKDVRNFGNKSKWLSELAEKMKKDKNIPPRMEALTELPGLGLKSANVIHREAGVPQKVLLLTRM